MLTRAEVCKEASMSGTERMHWTKEKIREEVGWGKESCAILQAMLMTIIFYSEYDRKLLDDFEQ